MLFLLLETPPLNLLADRNEATGLIIFLGVLMFVVLPLVLFAQWTAKKRTEDLQNIADELGLPFFPKGDDTLLGQLSHFHLFSQGRRKKLTNMMHGETSRVEVAIFDYQYTVGGGKNSTTYKQSVIYFCSPKLDLPDFSMRPESFFHKIGGAFGYQDIDFDSHPEFSKTYLLRGTDEAAIRDLFDDERLAFIEEEQKKICIEGGGNQVMYYRQKNRVKPELTRQFMEYGFRVFNLFSTREDS